MVFGEEGVEGGEVDIGAVGGDPDQAGDLVDRAEAGDFAGGGGAGAGGDELGAAVDVLIDVLALVGVGGDEGFGGGEEGAAVCR